LGATVRNLFLVIILLTAAQAIAGTTVRPTTTLAAETGNNTSAADAFAGLSNGNIAASNISKEPLRSLLYPGATTKIYVHHMPWFGGKNHVSVGYESASATQAARQVADMVSRGVDGAIIDWYGPFNTRNNDAAIYILQAAEQYSNFEVAITEDYGAVKAAADPTQKTIDDLKYAWSTFMQSPVYMRRSLRPVVFFFGFDGSGIDMAKVKASVPGNPLFVMRNNGGFTATASDGAFAWLATKTSAYENYMSLGYLDSFYGTALKNSSKLTFGSGFKGFDDTIAAWTPLATGRHIPQLCGQTWLRSMAEAGLYYSSSRQLENLQIVTWNDYEEGSALEPGVDNCFTLSAWVAADKANWTIAGDESTIDHYTVFISADGKNLMPITDVAPGTLAHDLKQYGFEAGTYSVFVKAVGKASIKNHLSSPATYTVTATLPPPPPPPPPTPDWKMTLAPDSATMTPTGTTQLSLALQPTTTVFNSAVTLQCGDVPANLRCELSTANVTPGNGTNVNLTLTAVQTTAANHDSGMMLSFSLLGALGLCVTGLRGKRAKWVIAAGVLIVGLSSIGCGTGGGTTTTSSPSTPPKTTAGVKPGTYTIKVMGISGTMQRTASATLIVQ
jgi:hypothetical protein